MSVRDWLDKTGRTLATVPRGASVDDALARLLADPAVRDVYVVDDKGHVVGHLSHRRIVKLFLSEHQPRQTRRQIAERVTQGTVAELMERHFHFARPDEDLDSVIHRLLDDGLEDMPVLDPQGCPLGAINLSDFLREMLEQRGATDL